MRRYLLATVSSLALFGSASAADMPVYTKAPAAAPSPIWTGPYVGLSIGALHHELDARMRNPAITPSEYNPGSFSDTAVTLGGQIGYNWQQDKFVYGLEADLNWTNADASGSRDQVGSPTEYSSKMSWYGTARVRAGVTLSPTLLYVTGGLAVADIKDRFSDSFTGLTATGSKVRTGWTVGTGFEHIFASNMTVKAEVLYMDFGRRDYNATIFSDTYTGRFKNTAIVGRVGVNVRW